MTEIKNDDKLKQVVKTPEDQVREKLEKLFSDKSITNVAVVFTHAECEEPQVWRKGHWYDNATLLNEVLNAYRLKAVKELGL